MAYGIQVRDADGIMRDLNLESKVRSIGEVSFFFKVSDGGVVVPYPMARGYKYMLFDEPLIEVVASPYGLGEYIKTLYWKIENNSVRFSLSKISHDSFCCLCETSVPEQSLVIYGIKKVIAYV